MLLLLLFLFFFLQNIGYNCFFFLQVNELKGNRRGLQENIKSREDELRGPQYRNAEKNFKKKLIEVTVSIRLVYSHNHSEF